MTINEQLKTSFPPTIKAENQIFGALVTNSNKNGAIESVLQLGKDYEEEYINSNDAYSQSHEMLIKTASFFSYLTQYSEETDDAYINRLKAIFVRGGDTSWGSPYDILNVFRLYFENADIHLCENIGTTNLIVNGEFQQLLQNWTSSDLSKANVNRNARFSKSNGVYLKDNGSISQTITIEESQSYYLHFFMKGKIKVQVTNSEGLYWNNEIVRDVENCTWINGKWQEDEYSMEFESSEWEDNNILIVSGENQSINVSFIGNSEENSSLDYIRMYKYQNPSFSIIVHYEASADMDAAALVPGHNDKTTDPLDNYYYHDNAYLTGVSNGGYAMDIYQDLLKYVKSCGVQAILEIVNQDE